MKRLITFMLPVLLFHGVNLSAQIDNDVYPTEFIIPYLPPTIVHGEAMLGMGITWRDGIDFGSAAAHPFFKPLKKAEVLKTVSKTEYLKGQWNFKEVTDTKEYARSLYINFKVSLGFIDFKAALAQAHQEMESKRVLVGSLEVEEWGESISPSSVSWASETSEMNKVEAATSPIDRFNWFTGRYGTHYISSVKKGIQLKFLATCSKSSSISESDLGAALRVWVFQADFDSKYKEAMSKGELEISTMIVCGSIQPQFSFAMRSFEEIDEFLVGMKSGRISITSTTTGFKIKSYSGTLSAYPKTAEIYGMPKPLTNTEFLMLSFPKGTILAFDNSSPIPKGWEICDGKDGRPNLINRYIIGAENQSEARIEINQKHSHSFSTTTDGLDDTGPDACKACGETEGDHKHGHKHNVKGNTDEKDVYPPSTKFVYIIKV